jgi:hypothetical protein
MGGSDLPGNVLGVAIRGVVKMVVAGIGMVIGPEKEIEGVDL